MKNKDSIFWCVYFAGAYFELCGDLDPDFFWNPWDKTGAGKSGNRHCFVYIWRKRSVSFICNQNSAVRIFVWESEYDSLQYGRGYFQSRHHGVAS